MQENVGPFGINRILNPWVDHDCKCFQMGEMQRIQSNNSNYYPHLSFPTLYPWDTPMYSYQMGWGMRRIQSDNSTQSPSPPTQCPMDLQGFKRERCKELRVTSPLNPLPLPPSFPWIKEFQMGFIRLDMMQDLFLGERLNSYDLMKKA